MIRILFLAAALVFPGARAAGQPVQDVQYQPSLARDDGQFVLVEGCITAVEVKPGSNWVRAMTLKVTHVFAGAKHAKVGQVLTDERWQPAERWHDGKEYKPGRSGIWVFSTSEKTMTSFRRYLDDGSDRFRAYTAWARTIEKLAPFSSADRVSAAKSLCSDDSEWLAELGVQVLATVPNYDDEADGAHRFVRTLAASPTATLPALIEADRQFLFRDGELWIKSEDRKRLLKRFTARHTDKGGRAVCNYLVYVSQGGYQKIPPDQAIQILSEMQRAEGQPTAVRKDAISATAGIAYRDHVLDPAFNLFAEVLDSPADSSLRIHAASGLVSLTGPPNKYCKDVPKPKLTASQIATLRKAAAGEKDTAVAKLLREAIAALP